MAEEKPSLHIDTDWKKQAQEEKKRLVEDEARKAKESAPAASATIPGSPQAPARPGATATRGRPEIPAANFATLVQSILTQILYYLGDLTSRGGEPNVNLDMAKHQIDILGVLEEKTRNNITEEEKQLLDSALYETRMRYVSVASQFT
jgi:hypothetical protein